jgi:hypothetical protein
MSTTHNDGETPSEREPKERPSQRLHGLHRADLRPFEPVSNAQILAAISRAEVHHRQDDASRSDIAAHLGFAHNSWTTRRLRPQLDALRSAGCIRDVRRCGLDLLALTAAGRRALGKARRVGEVILPESPQHRIWRHSRTLAHERLSEFGQALRGSLAEAGVLLGAEQVPSDAWFDLAECLRKACWQLGSATYCLHEWPEPDDSGADIDEETRFRGRRNVWQWDRL